MATWDRYKARETSFETRSRVGSVFKIRGFCDDPTGTTYVTKAPVCKLKLTPTVQFINTNIAWDISQSVSSTGTIDTFDIAWGGTTDIGDLSAQDWATDPKTGNVQYTGTGTYTVTASVTDTLAKKSHECKSEVQIVDFVSLQRCYIGTTDGGLYILTPSSGPSQSNTGLTGNHPNFRSLRMHPAYKDLPTGQHHLWACTQDGVAYTTDSGANWTVIGEATLGTPVNDAADSPAPTAANLDNIDLAFDPQDPRRVYVLRTWASPKRAWLYLTNDYGATWTNVQVNA